MSSGLKEYDHMFSGNNITPWHKVGTVIPGLANAEQAISLAKLDWEVNTEPVYDSDSRVIPGYKRVYRTDINRTFGIVGEDYTPIQNLRLAQLAEALVKEESRPAVFETAGSIFNGEIVWFLLNLRDFKLANEEVHRTYLSMLMGHGGNKSITALITNVRQVCKNTINQSLAEGERLFKKKHTKNVEINVINALSVIASANNRSTQFETVANKMTIKPIRVDEANNLTVELLGGDMESTRSKNRRDEIIELFRRGRGNNGRTIWDWVNAVTEYVDHTSPIRITDNKNEDEVRLSYAMFGSGQRMKQEAFDMATALV